MQLPGEERLTDAQLDEVDCLLLELGSRMTDLEDLAALPEVLYVSARDLTAAVRLLNRSVGRSERLMRS